MGLRGVTSYLLTRTYIKLTCYFTFWNTLDAKTSHRQPWTHKTHHGPDSGEVITFPHIVYSMPLRSTHIRMAFCPRTPKEEFRNCPGLDSRDCKVITLCSDLRLRWGLKQSCISPQNLSNGVSYHTYMHQIRVDSWLLVVGSQTANLTCGPSFCHNLCYKSPNGSCEPIFDIYTLLAFQWYKEHPNARWFVPYNWTLKFQESQRTLSPNFGSGNFILTFPLSRVATK